MGRRVLREECGSSCKSPYGDLILSPSSDLRTDCPETASLTEWLQELRKDRPLSPIEEMKEEMEQAIRAEKYERAAELRDAIQALLQKKS